MTSYAIRRFALFPAFKFGSLVGGVIMLLPGLLLGLLARFLVGILRGWLEAWQALSLGPLEADPLDILKLTGFLHNLQTLDDRGWLLVLAVTLATAVAGALLIGLLTTLGAAVYNLLATISGGLVVEAQTVAGPVGGALPTEGSGAALPQPGATPLPQPPPPQPYSSAWLTLSKNPQQRWPLKPGITALGSAPDNDVLLADLAAHHAEVRFEANRYVLYDLSSGQTWVNDRPIAGPNMLKDGFRIRLGNHELIFHRSP